MFDNSSYDDSPTLNNSQTCPPISDRGDDVTEDYPLKYISSYSLEQPTCGLSSTAGDVDDVAFRSKTIAVDSSVNDDLNKLSDTRGRDVGEILVDFCGRTSSHGIPHIGSSPSLIGKLFWTVVFLACSVAFIMHTYYTIAVYLDYSVILQMQLEFTAVPFPAVTVCNLNPYKMSMIINMSEIQEERIFDLDEDDLRHPSGSRRLKRQVYYEIVYAKCRCLSSLHEECVPFADKSEPSPSTCLCYLDVTTGNIWPCYDETVWHDHRCAECSTSNACPFPPRAGDPTLFETDEPCLCQNISRFCVRRHDGPIRFWEGYNYGTRYATTAKPPPLATSPKPYVPQDLDRGVEIQEIVGYIMATKPEEVRRNMSYGLNEFIILCAFNGAQCNKERDFRLHDTPRHGNCYTYNFNSSVNLTNSRAGPLYGLRLLLNVNQADYLSYIEGAGVRVVVHHQGQYPFPDTFGYSAPVGAISSFGLKYKHFHRKGHPWSNCTVSDNYDKKDKDYLFEEHYSTEGCYRSCVQKILLKNCKCNSHRFPKFKIGPICNYLDKDRPDKECMNEQEEQINRNNSCSCLQPCSEPVYHTSYSAASWPADNYRIKEEHCAIAENMNQSCTDYNRENTAFIEVFYEQLNYEKLTEVEATTIVNLFADFGGNIGLWIGFSTITVVEFLELALELFYHCYYTSTKPVRKWSRSKSMLGVQYVNQIAEQSYPKIKKDFTIESSLSSPLGNNDVRRHQQI